MPGVPSFLSSRLYARVRVAAAATAVVVPILAAGVALSPATAASESRLISAGGSANMAAAPMGEATGGDEFVAMGGDTGAEPFGGTITGRSNSSREGDGDGGGDDEARANLNAHLGVSFDGLNHVNQRFANGGNQFSVEPPDQGMCAGNGFVMETVNDVFRVFDLAGNPKTGVIDLNTFYGYPAAIVRPANKPRGPFVTDPSCYFDSATSRWFNTVLTIEVNPNNGRFLGPNHLDIAVSKTADPTQGFNIYRVPVQDDGTQGTPNHGCSGRTPGSHGPCFGDFPHLGADSNGFFVTTNEYSFFGPEFRGAQIYAFSKRALARGDAVVRVTQFDTHMFRSGENGFTIWPAISPAGSFAFGHHGTEFFLSTNGGAEAHDLGDGASVAVPSRDVITWSLTNTRSLDSSSPNLTLRHADSTVGLYAQPPMSDQKPGSVPLADCLNNVACSTALNGVPDPFGTETESKIDSSDTREMQVTFAGGLLWGSNDTALTIGGKNKAGIEWWVLRPSIDEDEGLRSHVVNSGYLGLAGNNLTYPAIGALADGRGVMAFTVVGANHFPSAGYAVVSAHQGVGSVKIAQEGKGPDDGFTDYKFFSASGIPGVARPRWGDYGAASVVGNGVWIASEYIGQTCTLAQFVAAPFGQCRDAGGHATRTVLANWDTRISFIDLSTEDND